MAYDAGSAFISVVPSLAGFADAVSAECEKAAEEGGKAFAAVWSKTVAAGTDGASIGPSEEAMAEQGEADASRYAEGFQARLDASRLTVPVDGDTSAADSELLDLAGTAAAVGPVLAAVGAPLAAGLAAVAVGAGVAGVALGAFALAAGNDFSQVKTQADAMLGSWRGAQQAFVQPVISDALNLIPPALNLLTPAVRATSGELLALENTLQGSLGSQYWTSFATYAAGEGATAIGAFSTLFGGLANLLSGLAEGLAPELTQMDADVERWAADLTKWGGEAANGGLSSFLSYIQTAGPLAAHAFEQIGSDAVTLIKDAAPLGPIWLNILDVVASLVGDLENLNPELAKWALGTASVALAVSKLSSPIGGLSGLLTASKGAWSIASDAMVLGTTGISAVATAAGGATSTIAGLASGAILAVPGFDLLAAAVLQSTGVFSDFDAAAKKAGNAWASSFIQSLPQGADAIGAINVELAALRTQMQPSSNALNIFNNMTESAKDMSTQLQNLPPQLQSLGQALIAAGAQPTDTLATAYNNAASYGSALQSRFDGLKSALPAVTSAERQETTARNAANTAAGEAAGYTGALAAQYGSLTSQLQTANTALGNTETALNNLLGVELSAAQATTGFYGAVGSLTASLRTNGTALDGTSTKAVANQQAFEGVGSSITNVISAMEKQGDTSDQIEAKVQSLTGYIAAQAGQYGLTTSEVGSYLEQLGLTPAQVKTDLTLSGYTTASGQVSSINEQLNALNGKTVTATVALEIEQDAKSHVAGANGAGYAYASGTSSAAGGLALVGELGPELEFANGVAKLLGVGGPEVTYVPPGAEILTAAQTAGALDADLASVAPLHLPMVSIPSVDRLDMSKMGGHGPVTVLDQRQLVVQSDVSDSTRAQLEQMMDAANDGLIKVILESYR